MTAKLVQQAGLGRQVIRGKKVSWIPPPPPHAELDSRGINALSAKIKPWKFLEENIEEYLDGHRIRKDVKQDTKSANS